MVTFSEENFNALCQQVAFLQDNLISSRETIHTLVQEVNVLKSVSAAVVNRKLNSGITSIGDNLDSGDTAWMMTSTAFVLFMSIPGLALFYGGMAREKNVLSTVMQTFTITCLITIIWLCFGYSLSFAPAVPATRSDYSLKHDFQVYGDASRFWLRGMHLDSYHVNAPTIPESVFCVFQLCFAIISSGLICGSFAERLEYKALMAFTILWQIIVYCPIAHAVWHPNGFLFEAGVLDYAGGCAIEIASGISGLVCAVYLGKRDGWHPGNQEFEPHNILLTVVGASMLWVGWFGFNGGSANKANERAGYAILMTQISSSAAAMTWLISEWVIRKQPSVLGIVSGAIAGLVAITPAAGYVDTTGAFIIGLLAGPLCYGGVQLKHYLGYDDSLDAFGVHAIGGILGLLLTGFFVTDQVADPINGVFYGSTKNGGMQFALQLYAVVVSVVWSAVCTLIILILVDATIGLRVSLETEQMGLDMSHHRESIGSSSVHSDRLQRSSHLVFQPVSANQSTTIVLDSQSQNDDDFNLGEIAVESVEVVPQSDENETAATKV